MTSSAPSQNSCSACSADDEAEGEPPGAVRWLLHLTNYKKQQSVQDEPISFPRGSNVSTTVANLHQFVCGVLKQPGLTRAEMWTTIEVRRRGSRMAVQPKRLKMEHFKRRLLLYIYSHGKIGFEEYTTKYNATQPTAGLTPSEAAGANLQIQEIVASLKRQYEVYTDVDEGLWCAVAAVNIQQGRTAENAGIPGLYIALFNKIQRMAENPLANGNQVTQRQEPDLFLPEAKISIILHVLPKVAIDVIRYAEKKSREMALVQAPNERHLLASYPTAHQNPNASMNADLDHAATPHPASRE